MAKTLDFSKDRIVNTRTFEHKKSGTSLTIYDMASGKTVALFPTEWTTNGKLLKFLKTFGIKQLE